MFNRFKKKAVSEEAKVIKRKYKNSYLVLDTEELLKRQDSKIHDIKKSLSINEEIYQELYYPLFKNICSLSQCVPASENHHHNNAYGFLDHAFEVTVLALRLREGFIYRSDREDMIMAKKDVYTYAVAVAALCHDLGKLVSDIEFFNATAEADHSILNGAMTVGHEFIYRFYPDRKIDDHKAAGLLALKQVVPMKGLKWIQSEPDLFRQLIHCLSNNFVLADKLGDMVLKADRHSTKHNLALISEKYAESASKENVIPYNSVNIESVAKSVNENNRNSRAIEIANVLIQALKHPAEITNGKQLNEKGSFAWVTKQHIYVVHPRCFNIIENGLLATSSKIKITQPLICYAILNDAGFIDQVDSKMYSYLTIDKAGWNKKLPMVRFHRNKLDPNLELDESTMEIEDQGNAKEEVTAPETVAEPEVKVEEAGSDAQEMPPIEQAVEEPYEELTSAEVIEMPDILETTLEEQSAIQKSVNAELDSDINEFSQVFITWLRKQFTFKALDVNKKNAPIHFVEQGLCLVSPIIFKLFMQSNEWEQAKGYLDLTEGDGLLKTIKKMQYEFFKCNLHRKDIDRKNILDFSVIGATKKKSQIAGILIKPDAIQLLNENEKINSRNVFLINAVIN